MSANTARISIEFEEDTRDDDSCVVEIELPHLKPGTYEAAFDTWETLRLFGGRAQKLVLWFTVLDPGEMGARLPRYYNVRQIIGKPRRRGQFKAGPKSAFVRDYYKLHGAPKRKDRISVSRFENKRYRIKVRTVKEGADQKGLHEGLQYSVIENIEGTE